MDDAVEADGSALGEQLEALLDALEGSGLLIGPRERILASRLAVELIGRGQASTLVEMQPSLGAVLARSPEEREIFERTFRTFEPQFGPRPDDPIDKPVLKTKVIRKHSWTKWGFLALVMTLIVAGLIWRFAGTGGQERQEADKPAIAIPDITATEAVDKPDNTKRLDNANPTLDRIAKASRQFASAPTIDELATAIDRKAGWRSEGYAIRLQELTGLPRRQPLAIYNSKGTIWARLAHALERIESPGRETTLWQFKQVARASLSADDSPPLPQVYLLADQIGTWLKDEPPKPGETKSDLLERIETRRQEAAKTESGVATTLPPLDPFTVERALAISSDQNIRRIFPDAHWFASRPPSPTATAPYWAPYAAALLPLLLALVWLINSLALRKAYLRRRPPQRRPEHVKLVADAANQVGEFGAKFRRISQQLAIRTALPTARIDVERTIKSAIADGSGLITPVYESTTRAPEYVVLIERRSTGDQEARRHRELIRQLEGLLHFNVYYYRTEPSILEPDGNGKPVAIERVQAGHAGQRLLVLGSGIGFLDPVDFEPLPAAQKLTHWEHRALLTPVPLAEWGREEFELARQLNMPVGRATIEGLTGLSELLGLEGNISRDSVEPHGDALARPLPEVFRLRPQRLLYDTPPLDLPEDQVLQNIRNFLDPASFDWLCALAVYPAVQWDLTIYLGVTLPEKIGGDPARAPLYNEARIAALTQLPWLREGMMPNWLRRALMREMPAARSREVRRALGAVLEQARVQDGHLADSAVKFDISREVSQSALNDTFDDEVLLDFLARGDIEDLKVDQSNLLKRLVPKSILDRIGWPELIAAGVACIYAAAAFLLTPQSDTALVTGAWSPLTLLALGAVIALGLANPGEAFAWIRHSLMRATTFGLALAIAFLFSAPLNIAPITATRAYYGEQVGCLAAAVLALMLARQIVKRLWLPTWVSTGSVSKRAAAFSAKALVLAVLVYGLWQLLDPIIVPAASRTSIAGYLGVLWAALAAAAPVYVQSAIIISLGLIIFLLGYAAAKFLPEHLPEPQSMSFAQGPDWAGGALRVAVCLIPILPAIYLSAELAASSVIVKDVSREITARAELPDGSLLALGGSDGKVTILEFDAHGDFNQTSKKYYGGSVVDLAVHRLPSGGTKIAVALRDGTIRGGVISAGPNGLGYKSSFLRSARKFADGAPIKLAFLANGGLIRATESDTGESQISVEGRSKEIPISNGPVTALAPAGSGFVYATMDGKLWHVSDPTYQVKPSPADPKIDPTVADFRRFGRARTLKVVPDQRNDRFRMTAIGDDGTVITGYVGDGFEELKLVSDHRQKLGLTTKPVLWRGPDDGTGVATAPSGVRSKRASLVYDVEEQKILHAENIDALRFPASLVKVMTLYIVFDRLANNRLQLNDQIVTSARAAATPPSKAGLKPGESLNVEQAISLMITKSANDVAVAVAEHIAGSEGAFAELMTRQARALGMTKTVFKNANGLPNREQVTTARDLLTLSLAIQKQFPQYYKYFSTQRYEFQGKTYKNHNTLLTRYDGVDGIKTGYIRAAGFNIIVSANRSGQNTRDRLGGVTLGKKRLIAIVMGGTSARSRNNRAQTLLSRYFGDAPVADPGPTPPDAETEFAEDGTVVDPVADDIRTAAKEASQTAPTVTALLEPGGIAGMAASGNFKPAIPFPQAKGKLPRPTSGDLTLGYGQPTSSGGTSRGEVYFTRDGGEITSPADGWVVYAGEFRSYGQLLIINLGSNYHFLIAGLQNIDVKPGQFVLAAEPVGSMPPTPSGEKAPVLYVELRKEGKPIDPSPWWSPEPDPADDGTEADPLPVETADQPDPNAGIPPGTGVPRKPIVVIDPGHGGADAGSRKYGATEKDITLRLSLELAKKLNNENGYIVKLTRSTDTFIPLSERVKFAEQAGADVFISLHADYARPSTRGATIYTLRPTKQAGFFGPDRAKQLEELENRTNVLAQSVTSSARDGVFKEDKPWRTAAFRVLRTSKLAAALIEVAYVSNKRDVEAMLSQEWRNRFVDGIAAGLESYFKQFPAERREGEPEDSEQQPPLPDPSSVKLPEKVSDEPESEPEPRNPFELPDRPDAASGEEVPSAVQPEDDLLGGLVPQPEAVREKINLQWPVRGKIISSFGAESGNGANDGIDIAVPQGTDVRAAGDGVVAYAGDELKGFGNLILLRHVSPWVTAYAHNETLLVKRGETVTSGQVIAKSGQTGDADTPRLHFELRNGPRPVDPMPYLRAAEATRSARAKPSPTSCKVWRATSYDRSNAVIIRHTADAQTHYTVLDINKGNEVRETTAYIAAYARGGEVIERFENPERALKKAFELCPEE